MPAPSLPRVSVEAARTLLLDGAGLLADPARPASPAALARGIGELGFVQLDTINIIERAHHHVLMTRFAGYRKPQLARLHERERRLFEHWTHDASLVPMELHGWWRRRFLRNRRRGLRPGSWWVKTMGERPQRVLRHVKARITAEGPLASADFEHPEGRSGPWWGWKPQKAALEYLWWIGDLAVRARRGFHKVYDLAERVHPDQHRRPVPTAAQHRDWACRTALERLGIATPAELAAFWAALPLAEARDWCRSALRCGTAVGVEVAGLDGKPPRRALARPDWEDRASAAPPPPAKARLLSPFDPAIRDRARALRLFGFHYRFEAFVPAPKRRHGYYVLPLLAGDRPIGRLDAKLHRDRGLLEVKGLWWEATGRVPRSHRARLDEALELFAAQLGAEQVELPRGS